MDESEGKQPALGSLQSPGEGGHGDSEGNEVVLLIDDEANVVRMDEAEVLVDIDLDLLVRKGNETVQIRIGFVDQLEHLPGVGTHVFFLRVQPLPYPCCVQVLSHPLLLLVHVVSLPQLLYEVFVCLIFQL